MKNGLLLMDDQLIALPNAPNANTGNTVVVPGIRLGQVLYWFKTNYPTVTAEKQRVLFGSTVQGSDPVGRFYSNLRRLARLAGIDEQQIRLQFLRGLSPANQMEVRRLGIEKSPDELLPKLEEIERYTAEQLSGAYLHSNLDLVSSSKGHGKNNYSSNTSMTETEVRNLVKSMMLSEQSQPISTQLAPQQIQPPQLSQPSLPSQPSQLSRPYYGPQPAGTDQFVRDANIGRFIQWLTGEVPEFVPLPKPDLPPKPQIKKVEVDSDEELANLTKKQLKLHVAKAIKKAVKSQHHCSKCHRIGHRSNSPKCPKNKKKSRSRKKGKVNMAINDSSSDSGSDYNSSNNDSGSGSESGSESESD